MDRLKCAEKVGTCGKGMELRKKEFVEFERKNLLKKEYVHYICMNINNMSCRKSNQLMETEDKVMCK